MPPQAHWLGAHRGTASQASLGVGHAVADPTHAEDPGRVLGVVAQLAPQLLDEVAHPVDLAGSPSAWGLAQQSVVGNHPSRVDGARAQQVVLGGQLLRRPSQQPYPGWGTFDSWFSQ